MANRGRPTLEPTDKQRGQVEAMIRYGIPETEIAQALGISKTTLLKPLSRSLAHLGQLSAGNERQLCTREGTAATRGEE